LPRLTLMVSLRGGSYQGVLMLLIAATARENSPRTLTNFELLPCLRICPGTRGGSQNLQSTANLSNDVVLSRCQDLQSTANFSTLASYAPLAGGLDPSCPGVSAFLD